MNEADQNHEQSNLADLHDRLIDRALAETIGRDMPPDLAARIMAAESKRDVSVNHRRPRAWRVALLTVAATLVLAIPLVLTRQDSLYKTQLRTQAVASRKLDRISSQPTSGEGAIGLDGLVNDANGPWQSGEVRDRGKIQQKSGLLAGAPIESKVPADAPYELVKSTIQEVPPPGLVDASPSAASTVSIGYDWKADPAKEKSQRRGLASSEIQPPRGELRRKYFSPAVAKQLDELLSDIAPSIIAGKEETLSTGPLSSLAGTAKGTGPGSPGDQYTRIYENPFIKAAGGDAVSTFSIDVDTASYANVRQFLMDMRQLPPPDAVRIEELVNYFRYDYAAPDSDDKTPFAAHVEVAGCPWAPEHRLVRIGIKGREIASEKRPPSNLVFLVDVSGSMDEPNKLPLVVDGLRQLTRELGENDRVAIVVYASSEGLALESTRGDKQQTILAALDRLQAGGSTAGGAGIQLAYQIAEDHFIPGGTNRVVLCTDGDFNFGVTSTAELERLVAQKAKDTKVFLSVLGFGRGNLNDAMMQTIADRGNGNHYYVDNRREARKVLVEEMTGTLVTIAKDVKIQVEFNPAQVAGYRLLGYENRMLRTEDFNDDTKDAGEIGAGHTVTALYEVIPAGKPVGVPAIDELKYQPQTKPILESPADVNDDVSGELLTLKMRYKEPEGDVSRKLEWPVADVGTAFGDASGDYRFAAAVAGFGLLLRDSQYKGDVTYDAVAEIAESSLGSDPHGYRAELVELIHRAKELQQGR